MVIICWLLVFQEEVCPWVASPQTGRKKKRKKDKERVQTPEFMGFRSFGERSWGKNTKAQEESRTKKKKKKEKQKEEENEEGEGEKREKNDQICSAIDSSKLLDILYF